METTVMQTILRTVAAAMKLPVMIVLIIFLAFAVFCVGWIIAEAIHERRHLNYSLPGLLDAMRADSAHIPEHIESSGLLMRQKKVLTELTRHPAFNRIMLRSLADNVIEQEESHYQAILKVTGAVSKLAPMAGLLGTLIPLGPGIIALGQGDTMTLSESMLTAFDTTIAGLLAAAVCLIVHTIRTQWYNRYMADLETLVDCIVEMEIEK